MEVIKPGSKKKEMEHARFMYEHVVPKHVYRRVARQIAGRDDLRNLSREERIELGKHVATLISEFGFESLRNLSNKLEIDQKYGRSNLKL